jgi:hypothetical protein
VVDRGRVGDVTRERGGGLVVAGGRFDAAIGDHRRRTFGRERVDDRSTDPRRATGHDGDFALQ